MELTSQPKTVKIENIEMAFQLIQSVLKLLCIFGLVFLFVYLYLTSSPVNEIGPYEKIENTSKVVIVFQQNFATI
mgnify:CR=1 FL=1